MHHRERTSKVRRKIQHHVARHRDRLVGCLRVDLNNECAYFHLLRDRANLPFNVHGCRLTCNQIDPAVHERFESDCFSLKLVHTGLKLRESESSFRSCLHLTTITRPYLPRLSVSSHCSGLPHGTALC